MIESLVWLTAEVLLLGGVEVRGKGVEGGDGEEQDDAYMMAMQLEGWVPGSGQPPTSTTVAHYIPFFMDVSRSMGISRNVAGWGLQTHEATHDTAGLNSLFFLLM